MWMEGIHKGNVNVGWVSRPLSLSMHRLTVIALAIRIQPSLLSRFRYLHIPIYIFTLAYTYHTQKSKQPTKIIQYLLRHFVPLLKFNLYKKKRFYFKFIWKKKKEKCIYTFFYFYIASRIFFFLLFHHQNDCLKYIWKLINSMLKFYFFQIFYLCNFVDLFYI